MAGFLWGALVPWVVLLLYYIFFLKGKKGSPAPEKPPNLAALVMGYWEDTGHSEAIAVNAVMTPQGMADKLVDAIDLDYPYPDYLFVSVNGDDHPIRKWRFILDEHYFGN